MRELQVGERLGDRIEVVSGVKAGERVAVTDVDTLADGTRRCAVTQLAGGPACCLNSASAVRCSPRCWSCRSWCSGTFSFRGLGVDLFPKADPATVSVALSLPGASPDEMSTSVVEPMEEAISGVSGIDEIQARIAEGRGQITVRFVLERDLNDASNDVREKVASAIRNMPPELLPPVITKVDPDADPVMSLIVSSDAMSLRTLTELTDKQIARVIQTVNGVGEVSLAGGRAREIHIVVDIEKLNSYGLSMTQVRDAVVAENVEIPGGTVEQGKGQLLLRTLGRVDAAPGLQRHRRRDQERHADPRSRTSATPRTASSGRRAPSGSGKTPAVMLDIRRAMGENTVAVIEGVRAKLATIERVAAVGGQDHGHPRRLAVHLRVDRRRSRST